MKSRLTTALFCSGRRPAARYGATAGDGQSGEKSPGIGKPLHVLSRSRGEPPTGTQARTHLEGRDVQRLGGQRAQRAQRQRAAACAWPSGGRAAP